MRKKLLLLSGAGVIFLSLFLLNPFRSSAPDGDEAEEHEEYENLQDRYKQEFEQIKDPALGIVPTERLVQANNYTRQLQRTATANRTTGLNWEERGPSYDFVGTSNGNSRAGNEYTAGIVQTFLVDLASDPAGNIVLAGSPSGGLWRCTNFLSTSVPNWQPVNDFMSNLAVASICQNPASPNIMYLATGDANTRDVQGYGIWKSTDFGLTWSVLPNTVTYKAAFKILCDNTGNVYVATGGGGLKRSIDGGITWLTISPSGLIATNPSYVTDLEISSTGRLHAIFGYYGTKIQHFYTDIPATVTSSLGWVASTGIRVNGDACARAEIAVQGDILYAVTANGSFNVDSCYKSIDGGATWTLKNTTAYSASIANTQAWYALTLDINPDNPNEFFVGSVDGYRSINEGLTVSRSTYWVGSIPPYVHADHHFMKWFKVGTENRIMIGSDGGMFLSRNAGATFVDRNQNLGIKQFYSCAIDPTAGVNFLFAGAQDNGCHQLKNAGLSFSTEVTGGDGAYVHINQQNTQIQFGSYVYNNYRRSTNGGTSWSQVNFSSTTGYFINPFDYDDSKNIMYASNAGGTANNQIRRWDNASTSGSSGSTVFTVDELVRSSVNSNATAFKVSPYTADRVFIGSSRGKLLKLNNASTVTSSADITTNITDLTSNSFPIGYINCVNTGTSDNTLVAVFTNYGIQNVWYSTDGGTSWTAIDGNLPDMPVWWAVFEPGSNTKLILGTESGVYATSAVNGGSTVWTADPGFPVVRTRMLKVRPSDNTIVAATYGRGLFTATIPGGCALATISTQPANQTVCSGSNVTFSVAAAGTGLSYQWRKGGVAINGATNASYTITNAGAGDAGSYDVLVTNGCGNTTSNSATLAISATATINTQPVSQSGCAGSTITFATTASGSGLNYQWRKGGVNITGATASSLVLTNISAADAASYDVVIGSSCGGSITSSPAALTLNSATAIGTQPTSQTVCTGTNVVLNVAATGGGTMSYQWRKGSTNITGATASSYTITNVGAADAGSYDVVVTGACNNVTSTAATLTVNAATVITTQPAAQTGCAGTAANFSVSATGTGTLSYQWRKGGVNITGATAPTYSITSTAIADAGNYDVIVTGSCGPVTSSAVTLTVNTGGGCVTALPNIDPDVTTLVLMPNTISQNTVLRISVRRAMKIDWSVIDAQGRVVMTFTQKVTAGQNDMPLHLNNLAGGTYYLNGTTEKGKLGLLRFEKL